MTAPRGEVGSREALGSDPEAAPAARVEGRRPPRPWLAGLLSLLHPGLGHVYAGMPGLGVAIWVAVSVAAGLALWLASHVAGVAVLLLLLLVVIGMTLGAAAYAWRDARRYAGGPRPHVGTIILAFVAFTAANTVKLSWLHRHVATAYRIPSSSMAPAVESGEWIFVVPVRGEPAREGEIVTYIHEGNPLLKRIVALPGDTIEMRHQRLLRNGRAIAEPYTMVDDSLEYSDSAFAWQALFLADSARRSAYRPTIDSWGPLLVPAGKVFVLGDNRHNSQDSRYIGFIPLANIFARPTNIYMSWDGDSSRIRWGRIGREIH